MDGLSRTEICKLYEEQFQEMRKKQALDDCFHITLVAFSFFTVMLSVAFVALNVKNAHITD